MPIDPLLQGLIGGFATEAQELAQKITRDLLELERSAGGEGLARTYENVARCLHTLKGSAATLGLDDLAQLAHAMEDVVSPLREVQAPFPAETMDQMLRSLDVFLSRVRAHADGKSASLPSVEPIIIPLLQRTAPPAAPKPTPAASAELITDDEPPSSPPTRPPMAPGQTAAPAPAVAAEDAAVLAQLDDAFSEQDDRGSWRVGTGDVVALMREVERLREIRLRLDERRREVDRALGQLQKLAVFNESAEGRSLVMGVGRALTADGDEVADIVDALENGVKNICTLPVRTVLEPLHRTVRDVGRATGKEAKLSVVGAEISLDRRVLEGLRGPMVHLVRNAVDHGIESPFEREKRGKHREGILVIRVEQQGNMVFLEFTDDGGGLNLDKIRSTAVERGILTPEEAAAIDPMKLQQLIFLPNFSTREAVTTTSGRGVGLDVVRERVQALNGQVEVQSNIGQGTRFIIHVPTDLGSSPILVVRCGEEQFGVPMVAVENVVFAKKRNLRVGRTQMKVEHGEFLLPLVDLGGLLGIRQAEVPAEQTPLLIIQSGGERVAVAVDEIIGDRELVIRPLPPEVRELAAYQGASTLARGELLLVLRTDWLVRLHKGNEEPLNLTRRALVVDDSLTARALHRAMLESGGYTVFAVSSAKQALEQLRRSSYEVIVSDIGMSEMDGIELTTVVRSRPETRNVPVILVSALDTQPERDRGMAAGADGFLSKRDCASGRLLAEVAAVISKRRGPA